MNDQYDLSWTPTCYFDGGDEVFIGGTTTQSYYTSRINSAGARDVADLDFDVSMTYVDPTHVQYTVAITNNQFTNTMPNGPQTPTGPDVGVQQQELTFSSAATDPDGDPLYYMWDWGDETSDWIGPYNSGETAEASHGWYQIGQHSVMVKVKDTLDLESPWSNPATVTLAARGDANNDGDLNIGDPVYLINFIFKGGPAPDPEGVGDANCDATTNIGDAVYMINFIFKGGPAPGCY